MKKLLLTILFSLAVLIAYPQEIISEFSEETLPVLNEELRKQDKAIEDSKNDIEDNTATITTNETDIATINALIKTTATANSIYQSGADKYLPDDTVDSTALKTATGEVSATDSPQYRSKILPGGTYGFYPQIKASTTNTGCGAFIHRDSQGVSMPQTYSTRIMLRTVGSGGHTTYAQQRYMTSSGVDWFVYLIVDKLTGKIGGLYSAPDHPSYGNGGDYEKVPHPFGNVELNKYEIILLDKETIKQLQKESTDIDEVTGDKRLATLINENYKVNLTKKEPYIPLHSGKYKRRLEDGKEVVTKQMIKTIPDYISVRKLTRLTQQEKDDRKVKAEIAHQEYVLTQELKQVLKVSGKQNLKEGKPLSGEEIEALFN